MSEKILYHCCSHCYNAAGELSCARYNDHEIPCEIEGCIRGKQIIEDKER